MTEPIAAIVTDALKTALLDYAHDRWDFVADRPSIPMCAETERAVRQTIHEARERDGFTVRGEDQFHR